ncbi:MAG TPA: hypothetical protein VL769_11690 [Acidimicrobiia bacterium]|nr:hypothetical protein [Acidimicrobiia bacterium]
MQQLWLRLAGVTAIAIAVSGCGTNKTDPQKANANDAGKHGARIEGGTPAKPIDDPNFGKLKDYVPAEFKSGADRWRDTGVYLDGKPIGILAFAELPLTLKPTWLKVKASAIKRADHPEELGWRWAKERRYKFTDYLISVGVDPKRVKAIHVYGPHTTESVVVTGEQLNSKAAENFTFRFGAKVAGKAIPDVPPDFGNDLSPDKITAVMIYVDKKPPTLDRKQGMILDGELVDGVPYYGEPLRGGVRVYLDNRLVAYIKRQELPQASATIDADGNPHWKLFDVLSSQGVDASKVVEAWVIRDEQRKERIAGADLVGLEFQASAQASKSSDSAGSMLLGPNKYPARAIALHTKPVDPASIPALDPDE